MTLTPGATAPPYQPDDYLALLGEAQAVLSPAEYAVFKVEMLGVLRYKLYEFSPPLDHRFAIALPPESLDRLQVRIHALRQTCDEYRAGLALAADGTGPVGDAQRLRAFWAGALDVVTAFCVKCARRGTPTPEQRDFRQQVYHLGWAGTDEAAAMLAAQLDRLLQPLTLESEGAPLDVERYFARGLHGALHSHIATFGGEQGAAAPREHDPQGRYGGQALGRHEHPVW